MKYYCIGIKGSGMSTLAQILFDLGNEVTGYDEAKEEKYTEEGLKQRGITIYNTRHHLLDKDTVVTYSAAFKDNHPEIVRMKKLGLEIISYNELLGALTRLFDTTCVCGTHGKTTTSLLIANILCRSIGCNYFVGDGSGYANPENKLMIMESCEYKKHFLAYSPTNVILTNIELEHTECYNGLDDIINTFSQFVNKAKDLVIMCGDDANVRKIVTDKDKVYYGFNEDNTYRATNVILSEAGSSFDVYYKNELLGHFDTPLYGKHMVLNCLAAIIICNYYKVDIELIKEGIASFEGAKRRFKEEVIGDTVIIDDYAHHPTELKVTLEAARQKYPNKELVAVFLPNTYSRTEAFKDDFIKVLNEADYAYVMDIHCDRENASDYGNITSDAIISGLKHGEKISLDTVELLLKHKNSVICFMSCTNIYILEDLFKKKLKKSL